MEDVVRMLLKLREGLGEGVRGIPYIFKGGFKLVALSAQPLRGGHSHFEVVLFL